LIGSAEIRSAHNIVISLPFGSLMERFAANIIDLIVLAIYVMLMSFPCGDEIILWFILVFPVFTGYHFLFEFYNKGQSLGKKIMKLRVVRMDGRTPDANQYLLRWIFRMIDITFSASTLGILFIVSTENKQRLGDIIAQTLVVSLNNKHYVSLESLQNLDIDNEKILYPGITFFSDQDMLLVKETLKRYAGSPNEANQKVITQLTTRISSQLKLKVDSRDSLTFLKRVLFEYILLTR